MKIIAYLLLSLNALCFNQALASKAKPQKKLPKSNSFGKEIPGLEEKVYAESAAAFSHYGIGIINEKTPALLNRVAEITKNDGGGTLGTAVAVTVAVPAIAMISPFVAISWIAQEMSSKVSVSFSSYVSFRDSENPKEINVAYVRCSGSYNTMNNELTVGNCATNKDFSKRLSGRIPNWPKNVYVGDIESEYYVDNVHEGSRLIFLENPTKSARLLVKTTFVPR